MTRERKNNKKLYVSTFIIAVMVLSVMGFMFGRGGAQSFKYNGYKFQVDQNNMFITYINGKEAKFFSNPENLETIEVNPEIISKIRSTKMLYTTFSQNSSLKDTAGLLQYQMATELWNQLNIYASPALMENNTYDLPIITCENATDSVPVIVFQKATNMTARMENNCIYLEADTQYLLIALKDRIMYGLYGIIQ